MVKMSKPRRGSLAFLPRGRATRLLPRVKTWPEWSGNPKLLGFVGIKAGTTHAFLVDDRPGSPTQGMEVQRTVTILSTPPMVAAGLVLYERTPEGLKEIVRVWSDKLPDDIKRRNATFRPNAGKLDIAKSMLSRASEVRLVMMTQPKLASLPKKKPDLIEIKVGARDVKEAFDFAVSKLGKEIKVQEVVEPGQTVDVIAVTRGKGFQGPVKRHGVRTLQHKSRKTVRGVGAIGTRSPAYTPYTVPRAGQMGYHRRTEINKKVLMVSDDGSKLTPKSGFKHFGVIKDSCTVIEGSVAGPPKRPVVLRLNFKHEIKEPQVTHVRV